MQQLNIERIRVLQKNYIKPNGSKEDLTKKKNWKRVQNLYYILLEKVLSSHNMLSQEKISFLFFR